MRFVKGIKILPNFKFLIQIFILPVILRSEAPIAIGEGPPSIKLQTINNQIPKTSQIVNTELVLQSSASVVNFGFQTTIFIFIAYHMKRDQAKADVLVGIFAIGQMHRLHYYSARRK